MNVIAVMLNWNQAELTERAAMSVVTQVDTLLVVDNASAIDEQERLAGFARRQSNVEYLQTGANLGYAGGCNRGIAAALLLAPDAILVMNNDAFLEANTVALLCGALDESQVGAVAPAVYEYEHPDIALHVECELDPRTGKARWRHRGTPRAMMDTSARPTDYVSGEVFVGRAEVFRACGVFDESYVSYYEDVEWSLRVRRAGWKLLAVPAAAAMHMVGASGSSARGEYLRARNRVRLLRNALGQGRVEALVRAAPQTLLAAGANARRKRIRVALGGPLRGWVAGALGSR
jgi:GT2 family glycosyltransferase